MVDKVGLISDIERVLQYKTSQKWCVCAKNNCETLLQDHAQNERNAAFNALSLMHRFTFSAPRDVAVFSTGERRADTSRTSAHADEATKHQSSDA